MNDDKAVKHSHVIDLVNDLMRHRQSFEPRGHETLSQWLADLNVPEELVGNPERRKAIRRLRDSEEVYPVASHLSTPPQTPNRKDVFSKFGWVVPLKNKQGTSLKVAIATIFRSGRRPLKLQTDKGSEFYNRHVKDLLKDHGVHLFSTHNETKASIVERFNRTLKSRMWKYFTANNTLKYVDILDDLVKAYNRSHHRSIGMAPHDVSPQNSLQVWRRLYPTKQKAYPSQLEVGDTVRISMVARPFLKGYLPRWTEELFTVAQRLPRHPVVYRLKDWEGEWLEGTFYEAELQKVTKDGADVYRIEKVIRRRKTKDGKTEYFVKWKGYPSKFNSWVSNLIKFPDSSKISIRSEQDGSFRELDLKGRHFRRIEGLASHLLPGYLRDLYTITYNDTTSKVTITPEPGHQLLLEGLICSTLGFEDPCVITTTTEAPYPTALNAVHHLFVYTDIIESQIVGHVKAPLLKTVPVHGESVIDTIEIDIRDDTGKKVSFERGRVIVKLHFRQKRSSYL
ncbi:hypothetical protein HOLleu_29649 [Holothuria leucospilota]|uniref:Integrase catalytic domain-containing protein n=1 Tax=Holothuria leucospilota TaxID=206669 RepID=A0A9Q1H1W7_HOLLE|nr:hypothetical protein HOLleu_29649 [Holothuria leucospilota]